MRINVAKPVAAGAATACYALTGTLQPGRDNRLFQARDKNKSFSNGNMGRDGCLLDEYWVEFAIYIVYEI